MTRVLVTGATGFIGRALCPQLLRAGHEVSAAVRGKDDKNIPLDIPGGVTPHPIPDIGPETDWQAALSGIDAVIHLAARVHVMKEKNRDPLAEFNRVNAEGTARLATAAAEAGVKRFVYLSTIKVMDETSSSPFLETDTPRPEDAYGISKLAGERVLADIAKKSKMEPVVLRPPLVYGPGVKGNFLALLRLCQMAPPLPFSAVDNRRSFIYVGNLADAILCCLTHKDSGGRTYFVRDGEDLSTPDLIRRVAAAMGRPARLFPAPQGLLRLAGLVTGKSRSIAVLLGNSQVNDEKIRSELAWTPPANVIQGLNETASWFASGTAASKQ